MTTKKTMLHQRVASLFFKQAFFLFMTLTSMVSYSQCVPDWTNFGINSTTAATLEYDNFVSSFHSTIVRDVDGNFQAWGQSTMSDGTSSFLSPTIINKTNFSALTGTPLRVAIGSSSNNIQHILLTSDNKLWAWGDAGAVVSSNVKSGTAFGSFSLPSGVTAANVKMLFATSKTLVITTCDGKVYVLSQNDDMRGQSGASSESTWYKVKKGATGTNSNTTNDLTGIVAARGSATGLIALDNAGNLWTWGTQTYDGVNNSSSPGARSYAAAMTKPTGSGTIKMIGATTDGTNTSYYVLDTDGKLFALGANSNGQLGNWGTTDSKIWVRPTYTNGGTAMNNIVWISPQEHDATYAFINVISNSTDGNKLYNWGAESGYDLGRKIGTSLFGSSNTNPAVVPDANFEGSRTNTEILAVESGGHTTMILKKCENQFGYVGHRTNGSMGCGNCSGNTAQNFSFSTAPIQIAGVITSPTIRNDVAPTYCNGSTITLVGQPAGGTFSIVSGGGTISGDKYTFPTSGTGNIVIRYTVTGFCSPVDATFKRGACKAISGTIWVDPDMNAVKASGEKGTDNGGTLWVNLVGPDGKVVQSVQVDTYGNYYLSVASPVAGNYKIIVTNSEKTAGTSLTTADAPNSPNGKYTGTNVNGTPSTNNQTGVAIINLQSTPANTTVDFGINDKSLPVNFGSVVAKIKGDNLLVSWSSFQEKNNDRFDVEASTDGNNFTAIGTVKTLAENGNSDQPISYEFTQSATGAGLALGISLLTLIGLGTIKSRKYRMVLSIVALLGISIVYVGCKKNDGSLNNDGRLYIRIAQIDKDGTKTYSKTVVATKE